jgi:tetratricopeptide (TPR) repeat protein
MPVIPVPARSAVGFASLLLLLAIAAPARPPAGPTIKFALTEGAKVSDVTTVTARATPDGDTGIDKVEFSVDDQLKATDTSTPYSFDWDTLEETEGAHTILAVAFDSKGRTAKSKITVTIDNELGKGAEAHAEKALIALKEGNVKDATRYSRRALKIDPKNLKAARSLAGIYREQGYFAKGVATLEAADIPANEVAARQDLIGLYLLNADAATSTEEFLQESLKASDLYKKLVELKATVAATETDPIKAAMQKGDAQFAARNWTGAIREYQKAGPPDTAPIDINNRLILTFLNAGRLREADNLAKQVVRARSNNAVTIALQGLMYFNSHQLTKAREMVTEGFENKVLPAVIIATYADMALGKLRTDKAREDRLQYLKDVEAGLPAGPGIADLEILRAYLLREPIDQRKALVRAMSLDPSQPEAYVVKGFQYMLSRDAKGFQSADPVLDYALKLDPKSNYALMAKALSMMGQRRPQEAEPLLLQLVQQDNNSPDVHTAQALNYSLLDKSFKINEELRTASNLDSERWHDDLVPQPLTLIARVFRYRFSPVLTPATLSAGTN